MGKEEQNYLTKATDILNEYSKKHLTFDSFYSDLNSLQLPRIQDLSFDNDLVYFSEVERVLSSIYVICQKPYINTKTNDLIVRADVAAQLNETDRIMTIQDTSTWRKKGNELSPEYVHYHEYVDQLAIYENIFIVHLLNLIGDDLVKYQAFYVSSLSNYDFSKNDLSINQEKQESAVKLLNRLVNLVSRLKDTRFYKEVSRVKTKIGGQIVPTNILMQSPLYRRCYIFYNEFISSVDYKKLNSDLTSYYYVLLLKNLKSKKYKFDSEDVVIYHKGTNSFALPFQVKFSVKEEDLTLSLVKNNHMQYLIMTNFFKKEKITYRNALCITNDTYHVAIPTAREKRDFDSFTYLTPWSLFILNEDDELDLIYNLHSEQDLINRFIQSHTSSVYGSKDIYTKYCPICKKNTIKVNDLGLYTCDHCHSTYYLDKNDDKSSKISLLDIRSSV
ncbi:MAG: hypothetical protein LUD22_03285 [Coprobacillus sp.]|nr:hypothetical protein [Coprobacillus sp.]